MDDLRTKLSTILYKIARLSGDSEVGNLADEAQELLQEMDKPCTHPQKDIAWNKYIEQHRCLKCGVILAEAF